MTSYVLAAIAAYFIGSIPTGYLWAKAKGVDIRSGGSGNIGATNVFRILGKGPGIVVLLIDALKGFLPAKFLPALLLQGVAAGEPKYQSLAVVAGLFAVIGHNYTCWLRFKGGKGIATSAGVLIAWVPLALVITLASWIIVFAVSRYVSLASVLAAFVLPLAVFATGEPGYMIGIASILSALAIYKHRANIQRLLKGTEHRFGSKKPAEPPA
jgi:acyl phosphate:glycerol-3-phosphate acyltransferase